MNPETTAAKELRNACALFLKDLTALPPEAFAQSFGGATRTVADVVYEVNLVNDHVGMVIREEEPFPWPDGGWITAPPEALGKPTVVAAFERSSERIVATVAGFSQEALDAPLTTEDGVTTRAARARFMTLHLWYHLGQLNYIQTLRGDAEWHWN